MAALIPSLELASPSIGPLLVAEEAPPSEDCTQALTALTAPKAPTAPPLSPTEPHHHQKTSQSPGSNQNSTATCNVDSPTCNLPFLLGRCFENSRQNRSTDAISITSHDSVSVIGALPLGSLHLHHETMDRPASGGNGAMSLGRRIPATDSAEFLQRGDVFMILDLPEKFTVGWDMVAISSSTKAAANRQQPAGAHQKTKRFQGIRNIPPGAHFIWVSDSDVSRSGYWFVTKLKDAREAGEIHVKQWDGYNEVLGDTASHFEAKTQRDNIGGAYDSLVPHDCEDAPELSDKMRPLPSPQTPVSGQGDTSDRDIWCQLTSCISEGLLERITAKKADSWLINTSDGVKGEPSLPRHDKLLTQETISGNGLAFLFHQDARIFDVSAVGRERTTQAIDSSHAVVALLNGPSPVTEADVVGELQFTFLTGLLLSNLSCLEQWWHTILKIVLRAHALVTARPRLATALLNTFLAQMEYNARFIPSEASILDIIPANAARLREELVRYKLRLDEALLGLNETHALRLKSVSPPGNRSVGSTDSFGSPPPPTKEEQLAVGEAFARLESWFWRYGWDLRADYVRSGKTMLEDGEEVELELSEMMDEDERGEYAAVVVELDEQGKEKGLVNWS